MKFKQICSDHGCIVGLGEDGYIYQIHHYTETEVIDKEKEKTLYKTRAVKLDPFGGEAHAEYENDRTDIPF